ADGESEPRSRRCKPVAVQSRGAPCDMEDSSADVVRLCDWLLLDTCVDGECTSSTEGTEGDPCVRTEADHYWSDGFRCDWQTDTCVRLLSAGEECSGSDDCVGSCNFTSGVCEELVCYCAGWGVGSGPT